MKPIGAHRRLADEVLGALRRPCERCDGSGIITVSHREWRGCPACEATGGFWTCSEHEVEAARASILERHPEAAVQSAPSNFVGGAIAQDLSTGGMVDLRRGGREDEGP
ncbi:MAG: hypothetical protein ABFS34_16155 [Gemmatimonadota bacterium]